MSLREGGDGVVVVLPQVEDKTALVEWLVEDLGPRLSPNIFPNRSTGAWRDGHEYELDRVQELRRELVRQREDAAATETALVERIQEARDQDSWLLDLLDGTDEALVRAVKSAFEAYGVGEVEDADAKLSEDDPAADRREDLRVNHRSPLLLVEVKGITRSRPSEAEVLQPGKYLAPYEVPWTDGHRRLDHHQQ